MTLYGFTDPDGTGSLVVNTDDAPVRFVIPHDRHAALLSQSQVTYLRDALNDWLTDHEEQ